MDQYDEVLLEVGDAEHRTLRDAVEAGEWVAIIARTQPGATIVLMVGGYDSDPRSLWNIPEAAEYVRHVALAAGVVDCLSPIVQRFGESTIALLAKIGALGEDHPYTVNIVADDPA